MRHSGLKTSRKLRSGAARRLARWEKGICLVTGGVGFIGSHLAEALVHLGKEVRILDNFSAGKREFINSIANSVEVIEADILDYPALSKALKDVTYVFHQAAIRSVPRSVEDPYECTQVNVLGTLNVLMAARERRVKRVVYASSSSVYGDGKKFPQTEAQQPQPLSPYAASKLSAEQYASVFSRTLGLETVSLRYFNVFGPRQDPESMYSAVIPQFIALARARMPLDVHWDGKQARDFTYVSDVVRANLLAATVPEAAGNVFNVGCNRSHSLLELIAVLEKIVGRKLPVRYAPKRPGDVRRTCADISAARKVLGYRPLVGLKEGLRETWRYFDRAPHALAAVSLPGT